MGFLLAFTKLVRPVNLLMIAGTMWIMRWWVLEPLLGGQGVDSLNYPEWKFSLSVAVAVFIAAAGNIINDYFDVRIDRINKPDRVVIDRGVKRRVAMAAHHACNFLACSIGIFLAWDSGVYILAIVPIFMAASLWFYSTTFKKQPLIGNFVIALMVAIVPLWAGVFEILIQTQLYPQAMQLFGTGRVLWMVLGVFAAFAFLLTLIREALKDLEDVPGDGEAGLSTMPLKWGIPFTKKYIGSLGVVAIVLILGAMYTAGVLTHTTGGWIALYLSAAVLVPLVYAVWKGLKGQNQKEYSLASAASKIAMAGGVLGAIWIQFYL